MEALDPKLDLETCISLGKAMAKKVKTYDEIILKNQNSFFIDHFIAQQAYYKKELIIYAKLANYLKYLEKSKC